MAKDLDVYDMADHGVNVTKSPIHLEDGELTKAQNWQTDPTLADGAIRRRDAMVKLNSTALAGALRGLIALPFPDEFTVTRTFYAPIDDTTTNTWRTSADGTTWTTITTATLNKAQTAIHDPGAGAPGATFSGGLRGMVTWAAVNHKIYFPGDDYNTDAEAGTDTSPTLYVWDGTTSTKLLTVPPPPDVAPTLARGISAIVPYSQTELLIAVFGENASTAETYASLLLYDTVTGSLEQLGPETSLNDQVIFAPYVYQGRIWIGPAYRESTGSTIAIRWIRPGDPAWTTDANFKAIDIGGINMVHFLGNLYMGTHSSIAAVADIRKRTSSTGAWTTVTSTDGAGAGQVLGPLIVTADGLTILSFYNSVSGAAPLLRILSSTDGTTWVTDFDISANHASHIISGIPYLDTDGSIYWMLKRSDNVGVIKKRTSAGVWSTVDSFNELRGPILPLKVVA
jgi:hypothetical protein